MKTLREEFAELYKDYYVKEKCAYVFNEFVHRFNIGYFGYAGLDENLNIIFNKEMMGDFYGEYALKCYEEDILPKKENILLKRKLENKMPVKGTTIKKEKI